MPIELPPISRRRFLRSIVAAGAVAASWSALSRSSTLRAAEADVDEHLLALLSDIHRSTSRDYGVYWPDWNANVRATFLIDRQGTIRFVERYGRGELPDPDRMLAEIKKLS